jgi:hypothetical protein
VRDVSDHNKCIDKLEERIVENRMQINAKENEIQKIREVSGRDDEEIKKDKLRFEEEKKIKEAKE